MRPRASEQESATEVFYYCNPNKATTCGKSCCHYLGKGKCFLTMNPEWGDKKVKGDKVTPPRRNKYGIN